MRHLSTLNRPVITLDFGESWSDDKRAPPRPVGRGREWLVRESSEVIDFDHRGFKRLDF